MDTAEKFANPNHEAAKRRVAQVVNAIAEGKYDAIASLVDGMADGWTIALLAGVLEGYKEDNELEGIDAYGEPCSFKPVYGDGSRYEQARFYDYNDGSGFAYEYDLTTDGDLNDLTLMLDFKLREGKPPAMIFSDVHVM